jgi:hypothetical protein
MSGSGRLLPPPRLKFTKRTPQEKAFFFLLNSVTISLFGRNAGITRTFL